ncbi:MAG: hypothetical protein ACO1OB_03595 [Archangium sp.]
MTDDVPPRVDEAQRFVESGDSDAATKLMVVLWREGTLHERALSVQTLLPKLAALHAPAREEFTKLRDGLTAHLHQPPAWVRWIQLCHALDDGAPVVQWLQTVSLDTPTVRGAVIDERLFELAQRAGAVSSFARIIDVVKLEAELRNAIDEMTGDVSDLPVEHRGEFVEKVIETTTGVLDSPRRALLAVGRVGDEARLAAAIERTSAAFKRDKRPS